MSNDIRYVKWRAAKKHFRNGKIGLVQKQGGARIRVFKPERDEREAVLFCTIMEMKFSEYTSADESTRQKRNVVSSMNILSGKTA